MSLPYLKKKAMKYLTFSLPAVLVLALLSACNAIPEMAATTSTPEPLSTPIKDIQDYLDQAAERAPFTLLVLDETQLPGNSGLRQLQVPPAEDDRPYVVVQGYRVPGGEIRITQSSLVTGQAPLKAVDEVAVRGKVGYWLVLNTGERALYWEEDDSSVTVSGGLEDENILMWAEALEAYAARPASSPVVSPGPGLTAQPPELSYVAPDAEVEPSLPEPLPEPSPTPGLPPISGTFDLLGHAGGNLIAVALDTAVAYLAVGPRLVVLDLSASQEPQELFRSEAQPFMASGLAVADGRLYWLSAAGRLLVFDLTSPVQPTLLSDLPVPPGRQHIAVSGNRLYIAGETDLQGKPENILRIYDGSDLLHLVELGELALPNQAVDLTAAGERVYVTLWAGSLVAVDVSDPVHPAILHTLSDLHGVYVQPPHIFAASMENLVVYDLSSAADVRSLVAWPVDREPRLANIFAGAAYQDYRYLFDSSAFPCGGDVSQSCPVSFHVLDVSDPADPRSLSGPTENPPFDRVAWAQVQGERLYVRDYHGLSALSLRDPAHPAFLWRYPTGSTVMEAYDLTARDGFVYLGANLARHSLYVFDLRELSAPRLAGPLSPPIATTGALSGRYLYLSLGPGGLSVLDVSQPGAPQEVARLDGSRLPLSGDLRRPLAVLGDRLYASLDQGGLGIIHISDPANPRLVDTFDPGGRVHDLAAAPGRLYVLAGGGLHVVDVSNPHVAQLLSRLELPGASQLALSGDLAFISGRACLGPGGTGGLAVVSLADPYHPVLLNIPAEVPCGILDIAVQDGVAILAAGSYGVLGVDVSDPTAPRLAYRFATPYLATRVAADGDRIYALDEQAGIYVLRLP